MNPALTKIPRRPRPRQIVYRRIDQLDPRNSCLHNRALIRRLAASIENLSIAIRTPVDGNDNVITFEIPLICPGLEVCDGAIQT